MKASVDWYSRFDISFRVQWPDGNPSFICRLLPPGFQRGSSPFLVLSGPLNLLLFLALSSSSLIAQFCFSCGLSTPVGSCPHHTSFFLGSALVSWLWNAGNPSPSSFLKIKCDLTLIPCCFCCFCCDSVLFSLFWGYFWIICIALPYLGLGKNAGLVREPPGSLLPFPRGIDSDQKPHDNYLRLLISL